MPDAPPETLAGHWDDVYRRRGPASVSWFRPRLEVSLELLDRAGIGAGSAVIDVGGGASTLVDDLVDRGVAHVTVADLSAAALALARERIGANPAVEWRVGDVTSMPMPEARYDAWHDRAVLHFLSEPAHLAAYARQATRAVRAGGHAVIGGFAPHGPERCSGLPVSRRDAAGIAAVLGAGFELLESREELHQTPGGTAQPFAYALLRRVR